MGRDPRKGGAFDSGMRGREKPKVQGTHGSTMVNDSPGSTNPLATHRQEPGKSIGLPGGVGQNDPVYSSGMRGMEKAKQKPASGAANQFAEEGSTMGGENKQGPDTVVGHPKGHNDAGKGPRRGVADDHLRSAAKDAYSPGAAGSDNSTELAAGHAHPSGDPGILGEEDETHINIRIPKASLKRKASGVQSS